MRGLLTGLLITFFLLIFFKGVSQEDTSYLKALYDRVLDFDETKADSVLHYASYIKERSINLHFDKGEVLSLRLKGIYNEMKNEYDSAISYYYKSLDEARKLDMAEYESAALGDLAMAYFNINQPEKTKVFYKMALDVALKRKEASSVFTNSANLGSIYNNLGYHDSALIYLDQAKHIADEFKNKFDISSLYNNFGNAWFSKKQWDKALEYFQLNYSRDLANNDKNMQWYDCLNIADVYIEKKNYDSAFKYLEYTNQLANEIDSKRKKADVYALYSKYYAGKGDYKPAYDFLVKWHVLDTALVSQKELDAVTELQERFNVKQKNQENRLLMLEVDKQKFQKKYMLIIAIALTALFLSAIATLLMNRRKNAQLQKQNALIQKQNEKLSQFNNEKNSMISVVSHDLSGPFTSIKMWTQILQSDISNFTESQRKALYRIQSSADNGELLIHNILHIEKQEINRPMNLELLSIGDFLEDVINAHEPQAQQKEIQIIYNNEIDSTEFMSDRYMLRRIFENLLSNAIKFSPRGKKVSVNLKEKGGNIIVSVKDEGVGIAPEDIPYLFSRYGKISSMPTEGEYSTGLGLSIVKRLVDELNGKIYCESNLDAGSTFTVTLPK
ncbi:MAG: tetratricopeptide repeat-containing sensor histidine kinase [Agriterribacter sp.]